MRAGAMEAMSPHSTTRRADGRQPVAKQIAELIKQSAGRLTTASKLPPTTRQPVKGGER